MAEGILRSSNRMLETLSNILTIKKLEFDKTEINIYEINIKVLIDNTVEYFIPAAKVKNIDIIKKILVDNVIIKSDERIISDILNNLVNNAIKFTNHGHIEMGCIIKDSYLILNLKDTGIGIPGDKLSIIFEEWGIYA